MAADDDTAPTGAPAEHDEGAPAGKHQPKGKLGIFAGKHRDQILVVSSVLLVVLAYLSLRKSGSSAPAGSLSPTSAAQAGLGGAGAVGGYNAAAQQGLQTLLANQSDQLSQLESAIGNLTGAGSKPPTTTASALSSPDPGNLNLLRTNDGKIYQQEGDGTLLWLTANQYWKNLGGADTQSIGTLPGGAQVFSTAGNLRDHIAVKPPGSA